MIQIVQYPTLNGTNVGFNDRILDAYNDIEFVLQSDKYNKLDFKFKLALYQINSIGGQDYTGTTYTKSAYVNSNKNWFNIDVKPFFEYAVPTSNSITKNNSVLRFNVVPTISYFESGSVQNEIGLSYTFGVAPFALDFNESFEKGIFDFDISTGVGNHKFLTDFKTKTVYPSDVNYTHFLYGYNVVYPSYAPSEIIFKKYNSSNQLMATNNITISTLTTNGIYSFGSGPANVRQMFGDLYLQGVSYYTVQIDGVTEVLRYNINKDCRNFSRPQMFFLTKYGVYDSFGFGLLHKYSTESNKKTYYTGKSRFNNGTFNRGINNGSSRTYSNKISDKYELESDWITDEESAGLRELYLSSDVFMLKDGISYFGSITNKTWNSKFKYRDELFNEKITFEVEDINNRQRT
jgi:hypothetical protein